MAHRPALTILPTASPISCAAFGDGRAADRLADVRAGTKAVPRRQRKVSLVFTAQLYFRANDEVRGSELWSSDGTEQGTILAQNAVVVGPAKPLIAPASLMAPRLDAKLGAMNCTSEFRMEMVK